MVKNNSSLEERMRITITGHEFRKTDRKYQHTLKKFKEMQIPDANKQLSIEFLESCIVGVYGKKIGKDRALRTLQSLISLNNLLSEGKIWHDVTKMDIKSILLKIEETEKWGDWERYTTLSVLRKFMTWLRSEYSYPLSYPDRERLISLLPLMECAPECKYNIARPNKLKNINEIPTQQEISYMMQACDTYDNKIEGIRDKCMISILEEVGLRISGIGTLRIKDVSLDQIGALFSIRDKTMVGEPVRVIRSMPYLTTWLAVHPMREFPEAPLWVTLRGGSIKALDYFSMIKALKKSVKIHNQLAELKGLPKITRRIHPHGFRYFAQGRDALAGMPVGVMCRQRGWSPTSKQPQRYARISSADVDSWLLNHATV